MNKQLLVKSVEDFILKKEDYYKQWIFDEPILISNSHHKKLVRLHQIMYKLILHYVSKFEDYQDLMIVSKKTREVVQSLKDVEYKIGTFRTDFVYDDKKQPKLIEITCRFALNTLFISSVFDSLSTKYHKKNIPHIEIINLFKDLFPYISELSKTGDVFILKGKDKKNESVIFKDIFEKTGINVIEVNIQEIEQYIHKMNSNSWIITELTLDEIELLDISTIIKLSKLNIVNDFRTALLIHDKQFFSVLSNQKLQTECLSNSEIEFFKDFTVPTYNRNQNPNNWSAAKTSKDNWILKHKSLGKSKSIYAGIVTKQEEWDCLFEEENLEDFVLQEWIPQTPIIGSIKGKEYKDYVTGTLLFFNDNYFGLGPFRTSSFPVTNVLDDRKAMSLILKKDIKTSSGNFLNYIE